MKRIHKFTLYLKGLFEQGQMQPERVGADYTPGYGYRWKIGVEAPYSYFRVISIDEQDGSLVVWAEVILDNSASCRGAVIYGVETGKDFDIQTTNERFIRTMLFHRGAYVLHFYAHEP